ncbi:non-ribosomal peptide synthetase [Amycolatopsis orientalis]|nr:non-ribosomal peptide synthetase [Amycolatopsis orientalis]
MAAVDDHPHNVIRYADRAGHTDQTYADLLDTARRFLTGLRGHGLEPGDKVILLLDRPQEVVPLFWACVLGGFVPCVLTLPADRGRWPEHLAHAHGLLEPPLLVTNGTKAADLPPVPGLVTAYLDDLAADEPARDVHHATGDDLALLVLTSGSTGAAKAVMLTHANLNASMAAKNGHHNLTSADVSLNWITFDHVAALLECHLLPLFAGASQVHAEPATILDDPVEFLRLISRHRVTMTFTPNFLLALITKAITDAPITDDLDLSQLRHIVSGGEAIVRATAAAFLDLLEPHGLHRGALWPAFGMTETCAGCTYSHDFPRHDHGQEFANLGTAVDGLRIRVVDDTERPVAAGQVGHVQFAGPMITPGYYRNQDATAAAFTADGWLRSGDLGTLDDGRVTLAGRSKDSIIVNGVNYYSHELETALGRLDGVLSGSVAAVPIRPAGADTEQLAVFFATDVEDADEDALHRLIITVRNGAILHWGFRPALVLPIAEADIPRSSLGKIQRAQLRRRLDSGGFQARKSVIDQLVQRQFGGFSEPSGATETALAEIYGELFGLPFGEVSATAGFFDIGGTSLDIIRFKLALERRLGIPNVPATWLFTEPTVRGLAKLIDSGGPARTDEYDPLVTLQRTGDKTPLFCVHPGTGEVMLYVSLAKYFTNERPFHALRARGFNPGESFFATWDEMIDCYVTAIQAEQPHGPYAVAGYSYGGAVAFEIAKRLEAKGEHVGFVCVISQIPHIGTLMRGNYLEQATSLAAYLGLITAEQKLELRENLADMDRDKQDAGIIAAASKTRLAELDLDSDSFANWAALVYRLIELERDYRPTGSVETLTVLLETTPDHVKEPPMWSPDDVRAWDPHSRNAARYLDVTGEHDILLGPRYIETVQATLRTELDRALPTG